MQQREQVAGGQEQEGEAAGAEQAGEQGAEVRPCTFLAPPASCMRRPGWRQAGKL